MDGFRWVACIVYGLGSGLAAYAAARAQNAPDLAAIGAGLAAAAWACAAFREQPRCTCGHPGAGRKGRR